MIVKKKLHVQLYEALKQDILNQNIQFGQKLTNRGLQERYGVSSTPIRDAINRLYLEGLLEEISQVGARVIPFDHKRALDVNEVMSILNCHAVSLSAERSTPEKVVPHLETALHLQEANIHTDRYYDYDRPFHQVFFDFCDNSRLMEIYSQHSALWLLLIKFYYADQESSRAQAVSEHVKIASAYKDSNIILAERLVGQHFHEAIHHLSKALIPAS
jgi:DNA-binding GntR family transcriptional regulator